MEYVKYMAEIEELAACIDLPPLPPSHLDRIQRLYAQGLHHEEIGYGRG